MSILIVSFLLLAVTVLYLTYLLKILTRACEVFDRFNKDQITINSLVSRRLDRIEDHTGMRRPRFKAFKLTGDN